MVLEGIRFRKRPFSERNMFSEETYFRKECVSISIVLPEGMCFWKEHASRRNSFQERTYFRKAHYYLHTSRSSYSYKCLKVIQKAYLMSMLSGKTWDVEASHKAYLISKMSMRLHRKVECSRSHRPWPVRSPSSS